MKRLCRGICLIFEGKTLQTPLRFARLQTFQVCALSKTLVLFAFFSSIAKMRFS